MRTVDQSKAYQRRWWILGVLCASLVLVVVANSSLNVAIPRLSSELGATSSQLQWIVDSYAIVFAGLLLPAGALGDRFGRKGALQIGLTIFGLASLAATIADSPTQLIVCRAVMGFAAAFIMPGTLSILANVFPPAERPQAIAIWAAFAGAGGALGIISSGFLLEHFWWGSVFFVNLPLIIAALIAGAILLPTSRDPNHTPLDPMGSLLSIAGLGSLVYAFIEAPERGWLDGVTIGWFIAAIVFLVGFIRWEQRTDTPMLDLSFFRNRRFTMGCVAIFLGFLAMFAMFFVVTQYLQAVRGYSPLATGVRLLPFTGAMMITAPRSAKLVAKFGTRPIVTIGLAMTAVGMVLIGTMNISSSYWHFLIAGLFMGSGMGFTMPPSTGSIMQSLPMAKAGVGSAVNDTTREVGAAVGIAVIGSILSTQYRSSLAPALRDAPPELASAARQGISRIAAAHEKVGASIDPLFQASRRAFIDGMRPAMFVGGGLLVLATVLTWRLMPKDAGVAAPGAASGHGPIGAEEGIAAATSE